jgi:hypothetical protein
VSPRAGLEAVVKRKIPNLCRNSNHLSSSAMPLVHFKIISQGINNLQTRRRGTLIYPSLRSKSQEEE